MKDNSLIDRLLQAEHQLRHDKQLVDRQIADYDEQVRQTILQAEDETEEYINKRRMLG